MCFYFSNTEEYVTDLKNALDMIWIITAASLVFFMQAGFTLVEVGLTRAKNAGNIIMKNLMDFSAGVIIFWMFGWAVMYGTSKLGLFGTDQFFLSGADPLRFRNWMFQAVFAATSATIVSGAVAERTKFKAYLIYTVFISALIYPVVGHWIWNPSGWLKSIGFIDFAGSTVVHSTGGWAALMGAILLGPRRGKYIKGNGRITAKALPGHNLPLVALGVFILWFGWFGFNAGSTLSGSDTRIGLITVATTLSGAAGAVSAMFTTWFLFGKPEPSMTLNGVLAGLVGITAGCSLVTPADAVIIGGVAGTLVVFSIEIIDKKLHIDDPVGAVSVHGISGIWGTLAVGLFAHTGEVRGLFFGGGFKQAGIQLIGISSILLWVCGTSYILFSIIKVTTGLRVTEKDEMAGLDVGEHGIEAYSGFQIFTTM